MPSTRALAATSGVEGYLERFDTTGITQLRVLVPDGSQSNIHQITERFTALCGVPVEVIVSDLDDINTRLAEDTLVDAQEYDVALPATFGLPDLVSTGAIQPFGPFMAAFPEAYSGAMHLYPYGDRFSDDWYGFQTDGDVYLLFLREDIAAEARASGIAAFAGNATPASWDALDAMMGAVHAPQDGRYGGLLFRSAGYVGWEYISRLHAEGAFLFDGDFNPTFNGATAVKVIEDMRRSHEYQHPASHTMGLFENWAVFQSVDAFATVGWGGSQKAFNAPGSPIRDKLRFAALPPGKGRDSGYFNWGWSYVVAASAANPDLAYLFCALGVSPEASTLAVRQADGYFDPFMPPHYADPVIAEVYSPEFLEVHRTAMQSARADLYIPGVGRYMTALNEHVYLMLNGDSSVSVGLKHLQSDWNAITFELGRDRQRQFYQSVKTER